MPRRVLWIFCRDDYISDHIHHLATYYCRVFSVAAWRIICLKWGARWLCRLTAIFFSQCVGVKLCRQLTRENVCVIAWSSPHRHGMLCERRFLTRRSVVIIMVMRNNQLVRNYDACKFRSAGQCPKLPLECGAQLVVWRACMTSHTVSHCASTQTWRPR